MWDTETGVCYFTHQFEQPVRAVALSQGDQMLAISSDPFMGVPAAVHIVKVAENREEQTNEIVAFLFWSGGAHQPCAVGSPQQDAADGW